MVRAPIDIGKPKWPTKPLPTHNCFPGDKSDTIKEAINKVIDKKTFDVKDADHDGGLTSEELNGKPTGIFDKVVDEFKFKQADSNKDGKVDFDEYHDSRNKERELKSKIELPKWDTGKKLGGEVGSAVGKVADTVESTVGKAFDAINPF